MSVEPTATTFKASEVDQSALSAIAKHLADARQKLIETGTRNRLIHTPRTAKRARSIAVLGMEADSVFTSLATQHRTLSFRAAEPKTSSNASDVPDDAEASQSLTEGPATTLTSLNTNLEKEALDKKLLSIHLQAKTAEEEQGINILFLAIGFLRWFEDSKSEVLRESPLILLPVSLVRDMVRSTFQIRAREDDIVTNQPIQERLRKDFGVALPEIPEEDSWGPDVYFEAVRKAVSGQTRWSVDDRGMELGFYSFANLLLIRDLELDALSKGGALDNALFHSVVYQGFRPEAPVVPADAKLDSIFRPHDLIQVVDADSSQTRVIETVRAGRSQVVQGPPGTGKSQTITNLLAAAAYAGKTVLFVAEKGAALTVVKDRMERAGLGALCLELHSRSANKKAVLESIEKTLNSSMISAPGNSDGDALLKIRNELNETAELFHRFDAHTGQTPHKVVSALIAATASAVTADRALLKECRDWSEGQYAKVLAALSNLSALMETAGPHSRHPFLGITERYLQPADLTRLKPVLEEFADFGARVSSLAHEVAAKIFVDSFEITFALSKSIIAILDEVAPIDGSKNDLAGRIAQGDPDLVIEATEAGLEWQSNATACADSFHPAALDVQLPPMRADISTGLTSFFRRLRRPYRHASASLGTLMKSPIPKSAAARIAALDKLALFQNARNRLKGHNAAMTQMVGSMWSASNVDYSAIRDVAVIIAKLSKVAPKLNIAGILALHRSLTLLRRENISAVVEKAILLRDQILEAFAIDLLTTFSTADADQLAIRDVAEKASLWALSLVRYNEWVRLDAADQALRSAGAVQMADALTRERMTARASKAQLETARAESLWKKFIQETPRLSGVTGDDQSRLIKQFSSLEVDRFKSNVLRILAFHSANMPRGHLGPMATIRAEIGKKRAHMPIRKLIRNTGATIQKIKPVFMMSPISVAQFLPLGSVKFDLLVIDEASQVRPEDALGLIARCGQIVVVGDKKQLPPTSFFDRMMSDEVDVDEDDESLLTSHTGSKATQLESILTLCEARGITSSMLGWHYRSRHPSLIEVSNAEFYKGLTIPPSVSKDRASEGLILRRVNGAYDRGGTRTNRVEAEAIVEAITQHARKTPELTLGVVTFSTVQRDLITDLIETARRTDIALNDFLQEGGSEDVFVKNLENVQGDERDVIFLSVGYGPRNAGSRLDSMSFGPVSSEGGERRLNVIFTRARCRYEIFVSFDGGDIDLAKARGEGPRVLKRFLDFAETGVLEHHVSTSEDFDSPFEETVASAIERFGYLVDKQVGSAGFKIDLGVRHPEQPGRYILAVECDGATYHSALWARERDRMRQEILEGRGWAFHRIWSTDFFYRPEEALRRLERALGDARLAAKAKAAAPSLRPTTAAVVPVAPKVISANIGATPHRTKAPTYKVTVCAVPANMEPHEVPIATMANIVFAIVSQEGPIHQDEIGRRVAELFGKDRAGARIAESARRALVSGGFAEPINLRDGFWATSSQLHTPPVRDRSMAPLSVQRADMISPMEIRAAILLAEKENGALSESEIPNAVSRLFGFQRTGPELKAAILKAAAR